MTFPLRAVSFAAALAVATAARAQAPAPDAPTAPEGVSALLVQSDALWKERDQPGKLDEIRAGLTKAEKLAPDDYGVLWRLARLDFWTSDDTSLSEEERSRLGKRAWECGDRAAKVNPDGVEGWYFGALGMGNYSLGIGILKALGQGIEGKFKERLEKAEKLDPKYHDGGVYNAWGRFYQKLPWPKYDPKKSEQNLRKALQLNPANVRARVYLAELYQNEGHPKEARKLLEEALAREPGSYDAPEERRSIKRARELLAELKR
ncbi:MAG TPA: tetratricopeptide repeat protein [Anaeromyxobacteraceae bacterium]